MKVINVLQNSPEWLEIRKSHFTASEAVAMLGYSKYQTRQELMTEKKYGTKKDGFNPLFQAGHEAEAEARIVIEQEYGEIYPITAVSSENPKLLASLDGMTLDGELIFEHKLFNQKLIDYINENSDLPKTHWAQIEQQLYVSKAKKCLFVVSDGDAAFRFIYESKPERLAQVLTGWKEFEKDLETFELVEKAEVKAQIPENLPALRLEITGGVTVNNLPDFEAAAMAQIQSINTNLQTDSDFATAKATAIFCGKAEKEIKAAKERAMANAADIRQVFETLDRVSESIRQKRLELEKLVRVEETARKQEIKMAAAAKVAEAVSKIENYSHKRAIDIELSTSYGLLAKIDEAAKNKRTLESLKNAAEAAAIEAIAYVMGRVKECEKNEFFIIEMGAAHLFPNDLSYTATKSAHDVIAEAQKRLAAEKAEKERIEQAKAEAIEQERQRAEIERQRVELERLAAEKAKEQAAAMPKAEPIPTPAPAAVIAPEPKPEPKIEPASEIKELTLAEMLTNFLCDKYGIERLAAEVLAVDMLDDNIPDLKITIK